MPTDLKRPLCKNPSCRKQFTKPQGTNRLYCFDCRPERKILEFPAQNGQNAQNSAENGENPEFQGKLTRLTVKTLEKADVLDTWQGAAAVTLAELIDTGKGGGTAGAAGAIRAHREAMAVALAESDTGEDADVIDMIFAEGGA